MIAQKPPNARECPSNKQWCFSERCKMGLCQRLLPRNSGLKVIASKPRDKVCPIDGQRCIDPQLCREKCTDVKGIAHKAFSTQVSGVVPYGPGPRSCPGCGGSCSLSHCGQKGQCLYMEVETSVANKSPPKTETTPVAKGPKPHCHFGLFELGQINDATIWIGREASVSRECPKDKKPFSLVVCLIGGDEREPHWLSDGPYIVSGNEACREMMTTTNLFRRNPSQIPYMHVNWPDFGIPQLENAWWDQFMKVLGNVKGHVAMFCVGGHGRTGTAACIIACKAGWVPEGADPVKWLRDIYCGNVVESDVQADYIERMCPGYEVKVHCGYGGGSYYFEDEPYRGASSIPKPRMIQNTTVAATKVNGPDPKRLSKNQYKKYTKEVRKKHGVIMASCGELADGELVTVRGHVFKWIRPDQCFEYLGVENPLPEADMSPEREDQILSQLEARR